VTLLKLKRFAASSVKLDGQTELFNEAEAAEPAPEDDLDENTDNTKTETIQYERRKSRGRKPLPADLPRVHIEYDLSDADKVCTCAAHSKEQCERRPTGLYHYREIPRCAAIAPPRKYLQAHGDRYPPQHPRELDDAQW
jgi:hypothetical protein